MIKTKKELKFYLQADSMMNRGCFKMSLGKKIKSVFLRDDIMEFLKAVRKTSYYCHSKGGFSWILGVYYKYRYLKLSKKLGYSIGYDCFGYGLVLHHYGNIVIGSNNRIGNYANVLPGTCITKNGSIIGDFFFMGYGAVITKKIQLENNVKLAANSVCNNNFEVSDIVLGGSPAIIKKTDEKTWMELYSGIDGEWYKRYLKCEELKTKMMPQL